MCGGIKIGPYESLGGRGFFDFCNNSRLLARNACENRLGKSAHWVSLSGERLDHRKAQLTLILFDFSVLGRDYFFQNSLIPCLLN